MDTLSTHTYQNGSVDSEKEKDITLSVRSEEVQEIIGRPPHWLVRWGISIFLGLLILIISLSWFVRYPATVDATLRLTSVNAPKKIESEISGKLVNLCFENGAYVEEGEILAWVESNANHEEIIRLSEYIHQIQGWLLADSLRNIKDIQLEKFSTLGELQNDFQKFEQAWRKFKTFLPGGFQEKQMQILKQQIEFNTQLRKRLERKKEIQQSNLELENEEYTAKKSLAKKKLIASLDLANEKKELLNSQLPLNQTESAIINNLSSGANSKGEVLELKKQIDENRSIFLQETNTLISATKEWKSKYLISAPLTGKLIYASILQKNQTLSSKQNVFLIKPPNTLFFGEMKVSQRSYGRIQKNQKVLVKFNSYPYQEFGSVRGSINYLSSIPLQDSVFLAKVRFPNGLNTNYGNSLTPRDGMLGKAEIITADKTILKRIYDNMTNMIN